MHNLCDIHGIMHYKDNERNIVRIRLFDAFCLRFLPYKAKRPLELWERQKRRFCKERRYGDDYSIYLYLLWDYLLRAF